MDNVTSKTDDATLSFLLKERGVFPRVAPWPEAQTQYLWMISLPLGGH